MKYAGGWLIALGAVLILSAFFFQPTVAAPALSDLDGLNIRAPSEIYNLGLLNYQLMIFNGGVGGVLAGCVLLAMGILIERLEASDVIKPVEVLNPAVPSQARSTERCEWCDRGVAAPNQPCSAISADALKEAAPSVRDGTCREQLTEQGYLRVEN